MPLIELTDDGISRARLDEIKAWLEAGTKGIFGTTIDIGVESPEGQLLGIFAEAIGDVYEAIEDTHNGRSPAGARGAGLARLVRLNGITKNEAARSTGTITCTGTNGTVIPAGSRVANVDDATAIFETLADATIASGTATISVRSVDTGAVLGYAATLTEILTVISGWATATNAADVTLGDAGETDGELRARRAASVAAPSQGIVDGLRAAILDLDDVQQCVVRENPEDSTQTLVDGGTLVAHAIQVIVESGADAEIADAIFLRRSLGVTMVGAVEVDVEDAEGDLQTMKFDRPTGLPIYVEVRTPTALSGDLEDEIKAEIVAWANGTLEANGAVLPALQIGQDVELAGLFIPLTNVKLRTPGLSISAVYFGTSASPSTSSAVAVPFNALPTFAEGNITFDTP